MGVELNSHNFLSAVSLLVHPLDSCGKMALLHLKKWVSAFYPMGQTIIKI